MRCIKGFRDRRRSAHRRMYEIQRMTTRQRQDRQTATYRALIDIAAEVVANARTALEKTANMRGKDLFAAMRIDAIRDEIAHYCGLGERVTALVGRAGEVVSKDELVARVWPGVFVEDGNLRVHIAALRQALGDGQAGRRFIVTIPGRGYSFVAPATHLGEGTAAPQNEDVTERSDHLPVRLTRIFGRASEVESLTAQLPRHRLMTIVGPGGIGKTTVALAVADALCPSYRDGVRFVDLAPVSDPSLLPSAVASALGLPISSDKPIPGLTVATRDREMLLVLDSCEHVIDAAATLVEAISKAAARMNILVTSREALRVEGERVQRLAPLKVPFNSSGLSAADALTFPAVQLFVERA